MDPYRSPPEETSHVEPELDRIPVWLRFAPLRAGWIVVTPSALRFEPRAGRARTVPLLGGLDALQLSVVLGARPRIKRRAIRIRDTIESWRQIAASAPYQRALRAVPYRGILSRAHGHSFAGGAHEDRAFVPIVDGNHLVVIEAAPSYESCFLRQPPGGWPDRSGVLLGRALSWLPRDELARVLSRVRAHGHARWCRVFTREEVRARPAYVEDQRRFELLGNNARDAIALELDANERAMIEGWLETGHVG